MKAYQRRVVDERKALDKKRNNLAKFLMSSRSDVLREKDAILLTLQDSIMIFCEKETHGFNRGRNFRFLLSKDT